MKRAPPSSCMRSWSTGLYLQSGEPHLCRKRHVPNVCNRHINAHLCCKRRVFDLVASIPTCILAPKVRHISKSENKCILSRSQKQCMYLWNNLPQTRDVLFSYLGESTRMFPRAPGSSLRAHEQIRGGRNGFDISPPAMKNARHPWKKRANKVCKASGKQNF